MICGIIEAGGSQTNANVFTAFPGLKMKLPGVPDPKNKVAIVTFNVPNPFAKGNNFPGGQFAISVDGTIQSPIAVFTYNEQVPPSTGRVPTTLAIGVAYTTQDQEIQAMWQGVRGSTVVTDTPSSLSIIGP